MAFYLTTGVVSSLVPHLWHTYRLNPMGSLGASGAVLALVGYVSLSTPEAQVSLIFLPFYHFPILYGLYAIIAFDIAGLFLGWRALGHLAHLTGTGVGMAHYKFFEKEYKSKFVPAVLSVVPRQN